MAGTMWLDMKTQCKYMVGRVQHRKVHICIYHQHSTLHAIFMKPHILQPAPSSTEIANYNGELQSAIKSISSMLLTINYCCTTINYKLQNFNLMCPEGKLLHLKLLLLSTIHCTLRAVWSKNTLK